jgi:hypothetical protein
MPVSVRANAPDLKDLSRDLKRAGRNDLRKELFAGLNRSTKPLRAAARASALDRLPSRGGLNRRVAAANITVRGGGAKVTIVARPSKRGGTFNPAEIDEGTVRHPTFGDPPTVSQDVPTGWFSAPILEGADTVREELLDAIEVVAHELANG